jgi:hypothetical protein
MTNVSDLPTELAPDSSIRPAKKVIQSSSARNMGWLLAVVVAFVLLHIFAGMIRTPVPEDVKASGHEAISPLHD